MTDPPRFLCDEMLGKLASWLRLAGFDATYRRDVDDDDLLAEAVEGGRILLTRDRELGGRTPDPPGSVEVRALDPHDQLAEVVEALDLALRADRELSRCSECNEVLDEAAAADIAGEVPGDVAEEHDIFWRCPGCSRVYWPGSHVDAIRAVLEDLGDRP